MKRKLLATTVLLALFNLGGALFAREIPKQTLLNLEKRIKSISSFDHRPAYSPDSGSIQTPRPTDLGLKKEFSSSEANIKSMQANVRINKGRMENLAIGVATDNLQMNASYDVNTRSSYVQGILKANRTTLNVSLRDGREVNLTAVTPLAGFTATTQANPTRSQYSVAIARSYKGLNMLVSHHINGRNQTTTLNTAYTIPKVIDSINLTYTTTAAEGMPRQHGASVSAVKRVHNASVECSLVSNNMRNYVPRVAFSYRRTF